MAEQEVSERGRGFWTGLVVGLLLGALAVVALALVFPVPTEPPVVDEVTTDAPDPLPVPAEGAGAPAMPQPLVGEPARALIDAPPSDFGPLPARDPFAEADGSPSLFPGEGR